MKDYQALNIARLCNAPVTILGPQAKPAVGLQKLRGLPFQIGPRNGRGRKVFLGLGNGEGCSPQSVVIPIRSRAKKVLFAHRLLDSKLQQNGPLGAVAAHYVFHLAGGEAVSVTIRERFEISVVPVAWGQLPFLAAPDRADGLPARYEGPWGSTGSRQTEAGQAWPRDYVLYVWSNPRPGARIESVEIVPAGPRFIVAAVSLGYLDEHPFNREGKKEVKIALPRKEDSEKPFKVEVEVDRGVATFPYPLPEKPAREFLKDDYRGWGEARNNKSGSSYVEIAAVPSATITVKNEGEVLGKANWGQLQEKGRVKVSPRLQLEVLSGGSNWVHTRVVDEDTGTPIPCRIHFRSPLGIPYAPHGHHPHVFSDQGTWHIDIGGDVRLGQISYAYIDGTCQGWLPQGEVIVDCARGYEYLPVRKKILVRKGQRELEIRMKRWVNMNQQRYFSGDTHVHFMSTVGAHRESQGEDLNVVNLLQSQWGHLFTNTEEFTGRPSVMQNGQNIVYACSENRQHILGHLTLLGIKKQVMPWCSDGPSEAEMGGHLETTLSHWADACHAQGGTVVLPHIPTPNCEPATLVATGRLDAVEFLVHSLYNHGEYYRYLNCGYRLPICGGTDKMTSDVPVGVSRTYVYIPPDEEFNYDTWCRGLRSGNTFQSSGPMLWFKVNGETMGSTLRLPGNGGNLEVEARAESILPIHTLQIVQQGKVVASTDRKAGARSLGLKAKLKVEKNTWLAARCGGPGYTAVQHFDGWRRGIFAHTSPVYVAVGGEYDLFDLESAAYMMTLIEGGLTYVRHSGRRPASETVTHHHGESDHLAFLERPFREAEAAIRARMEKLGITSWG
ncbi:MAG: CehA/McbA family metallohydrolase [Planctomycetes bacterium]|nr:CehA/McbA family metallohydrolase [Planctomycetota bacterium]